MSVLFLRNQGKCQFSLAAELATNLKFGRAEIQRAFLVIELCRNFANVTRPHRILEADLVDSSIESQVAWDVVLHHYGAALCHDFALDYSRDNRVSREVSAGEKFVFLDGVLAVSYTVLVNLRLVNKKHRFSVRQKFFNVFLVHRLLVLVVFPLVIQNTF